ncbi:MAG: ABC transporter permease, partial [Cyclobacteriaceae bacterium]|nr:ABC transporter permease [Cyclobacteriaceae bacterium]
MKQSTSPKLARKFLSWFLRSELAEEVEGDLEEKFVSTLKTKSGFRAQLSYWIDVICYIRPFAIRKSRYTTLNYSDMLRHNFLISFRSFSRHKTTFIINLIGLSTGLACAILIYLWVNDELHMNKFHEKENRFYQIMENTELSEGIRTQPYTPDLLAETMIKEIPEIEYAVGITPGSWFGNFTLSYQDINSKGIGQYVGADFFNIFSFPLIQGNANQVLADKNSIVLSESLALRIFNTTEGIIGKSIHCQLLNYKDPVTVTGIFEDIPSNSTEKFDFLLSFELWKELSVRVGRSINWGNFGPQTYLTLQPNSDIVQFNKKIKGFIKSKHPDSNVTLFAVPYSNQYLHGTYENGIQTGGRIEYVRLFSVIA